MCSICGGNYPLEIIEKASKRMQHRGLDHSGSYSDGVISLAHNRLSIIDLDTHSNQPFTSSLCPHLVLVFNGEIYNYLEIRHMLEKMQIPFFTHSDTEVLLHAFFVWGEDALKHFNGDFAFAIYDKEKKEIFLARDRLGNKPLFYMLKNNTIFFASEIKAFFAMESLEFDLEEVSKWLLFCNGDLKKTIYKEICNFPSAHFAYFKIGDNALRFKRYWDFSPKVSYDWTLKGALDTLESLLFDALKLRLRSDVPVALSVSGGIDSSLLAHFSKQLDTNCAYFGLNFDESLQNETAFIRQLQNDLNIKITYITPNSYGIKQDFMHLVASQDEIFRSFSIYSQYLLFKEIAPFCKVAIGGQGADELFGGYYHHIGRYIFKDFNALQNYIALYGKEAFSVLNFGVKCALEDAIKLKLFLDDNKEGLHQLESLGLPLPLMENLLERFTSDFTQGLWLDTTCFNLPNLLRYEDRNAMAFGVENRTPFCDYRVVEFAFSIPPEFKFAKGYSKYLLRLLLERLGSKALAWRLDKVGFSAPESALMQKLGYNYASLLDIRIAVFQALQKRIKGLGE